MAIISALSYAFMDLRTHSYPSLHVRQQRQQLCRYRSKVCNNPRAHKRDGLLHRYCEEHRQRANANQKKWAKRRTQPADEMALHYYQLSYQQLLSAGPILGSPGLSQTGMLPPIDLVEAAPVFLDELLLWGTMDCNDVLSEDATSSDLLWLPLGLGELKTEVQFQL